jgi:hypothetical protein
MAAQSLRQFVLETLTGPEVDDLNFQYGPMRVYPAGYRRDIARGIRGGSIELTSDASRVYGPGQSPANGSFVVDTPRGQVHPFFINPEWTFQQGGRLCVRPGLGTQGRADLKGTIIHEATHALQDYQRNALRPQTAEGAAYLAGAIARRRHGYRTAGTIVNPRVSGIAYSLHLADRFLAETNRHQRYLVPGADVAILDSLVSTGSHHRYVFNGI